MIVPPSLVNWIGDITILMISFIFFLQNGTLNAQE